MTRPLFAQTESFRAGFARGVAMAELFECFDDAAMAAHYEARRPAHLQSTADWNAGFMLGFFSVRPMTADWAVAHETIAFNYGHA